MTTAFAFTKVFAILAIGIFLGMGALLVAFKPVEKLSARYRYLDKAIYWLILILGIFLIVAIPLKLIWNYEIPDVFKVGLAFTIIGFAVVDGEISFRKNKALEQASDPTYRMRIRRNGRVLDGWIQRNGELSLQIHGEFLNKYNVNTGILLDASRSMLTWYIHPLWIFPSKVERIIHKIADSLATIDDDGYIDIYTISQGKEGNKPQLIVSVPAGDLKKMKISLKQIELYDETNILITSDVIDQILGKKDVNRYNVVVITDGGISEEHRDQIIQEGHFLQDKMLDAKQRQLTDFVNQKNVFIIDGENLELFEQIDNLPGDKLEEVDPYDVETIHDIMTNGDSAVSEALWPEELKKVQVASRAVIYDFKDIELKNPLWRSEKNGVYGTLHATLPEGTRGGR